MKRSDALRRHQLAARPPVALRLVSVLCLVLLLLASAPSVRAETASKDLRSFADQMLLAMAEDNRPPDGRAAALRRVLIPGIDLEEICDYVLGDHGRALSTDQRGRFVGLYSEYLLQVLARMMLDRQATRLTVLEAKERHGTTQIRSEVELASGRKSEWLWSLRKSGAAHRVVDLKAHGISLAQMFREEVDWMIQRQGFDGFLSHLKRKL